jgi:hypothetical protein
LHYDVWCLSIKYSIEASRFARRCFLRDGRGEYFTEETIVANYGTYWKQSSSLFVALSCIALSTIGGADTAVEKRRPTNIADQELFIAPVPKAVCGPGDKPETGLSGQVPAALRAAGFQGFSCNLQLLSQVRGEGAGWQTAEWRESKRSISKTVCAYHGTAAPTANTLPRVNYGVRVIDITDVTKPYITTYLQSVSMMDPWESLKTNQRRKLLGAVNAANGSGGPEFDVYDLSGDCRYPQLLSSTAMVDANGLAAFAGHEGNWAPDGMTYYAAGVTRVSGESGRPYYAIDVTDTTKPKLITSFKLPFDPAAIGHGPSTSDDGNRGYFPSDARLPVQAISDPTASATNGLVIYDLSEVQARRPNPVVRVVSELYWKDGGGGQHTIPVTIKNKPYLVYVDESGTAGFAVACGLGMNPFPLARIIDIADDTKPKVVSQLMLEVHDPANCNTVAPDLVGTSGFQYGSHYCSVDNKHRATTLACGYFNSGIRVFDIRDPIRPREVAYYNPAGSTTAMAASNHIRNGGWIAGGPDWCSAQVHLNADNGTVWTTCQDNGLLMLKFTHNAWPFANSTTPPGMQN